MTLPDSLLPSHSPRTWAAISLALIALALTARSLWPLPRLAELDGFAEAVRLLEANQDPSSIVVVWPPEQADALAVLPVALRATAAVPPEHANQRRLLRIMLFGPAPLAPPPELDGTTLVRQQRFGGVEVQIWSWAGSDRADFDLRHDLGEVAVRLQGPGVDLACTTRRADGGWDCPGRPEWNHVGPTTLTVDGQDWPCVWAHPVSGHELVVDLGPRRLWDTLELEAALSDDATATPAGASVLLRLEVDGAEVRRLVRTNVRGIVRATLPTTRGETRHLRLEITTAQDGRRHLGLNLRLVERRAGVP